MNLPTYSLCLYQRIYSQVRNMSLRYGLEIQGYLEDGVNMEISRSIIAKPNPQAPAVFDPQTADA